MGRTEALNCPLCGRAAGRLYLSAPTYRILRCLACGNGWTDPPPAVIPYEDEDFHAGQGHESVATLSPNWAKCIRRQADLLAANLRPGARVLEVGCGRGILLKELAARGFSVAGVEPSRAASAAARGAGLDVLTGYFPHDDLRPPYDAVVLSQVLEHLPRPDETLRAVAAVAPGGWLLLVQTNFRGLIPRLLPRRWYAWVPEQHFWHFTPAGLSELVRAVGGQVADIQYSRLDNADNVLVRLTDLIPRLGDQFHLLARLPDLAAP
jgi:SAM-dependent methyltransferase